MTLGERICQLRSERNLSQGELAEILEVSRQSVSKWETNSSVPDLDKLVKLSQLFEISLDELVLGAAPDSTAPSSPGPVPAAPSAGFPGRYIAGIILLCTGALILTLCTLMGVLALGILLAVPLLLCGLICFLVRKNVGLWCTWAVFFSVDLYLRYATGITWKLTRLTPIFEPSWNYLRLATSWGQLLCVCLLSGITILRFRGKPLEPTRKHLVFLAGGWAVYFLSSRLYQLDPFARWPLTVYTVLDWGRVAALIVLLACSLRCFRSWRQQR